MKSIIEEIYLGKRGNHNCIKPSEEYRKIHVELNKHYEDLKNQLSEKQKAMLDELDCKMAELSAEHSITNFIEGFKLGMLIAIETFSAV